MVSDKKPTDQPQPPGTPVADLIDEAAREDIPPHLRDLAVKLEVALTGRRPSGVRDN